MSIDSPRAVTLDAERELVGIAMPPAAGSGSSVALSTEASDRVESGDAPSASVYVAAYRAAMSRMRRTFVGATHLDEGKGFKRERVNLQSLFRRMSIAHAAALMHEYDGDLRNDELLNDFVRTSLISWQMSIRHDGRPVCRPRKSLAWQVGCAARVASLLEETSTFHSSMLLNDLNLHLQWIADRPAQRPFVEAALICALADGALVTRNTKLREAARQRAKALLFVQSDEGWFPEPGSPDLGRLTLTVDALARLHIGHGWEQLAGPLSRALRFMRAVGAMDCPGGVLGMYAPSPSGVETLAPIMPDAAWLARTARVHCAEWTRERFSAWSDDLFCLILPRIVKASVVGLTLLPVYPSTATAADENRSFPLAAVTVRSTENYRAVIAARRGGALRVTWHDGSPSLVDTGIIVVYPHSTRCSASGRLLARPIVDEHAVSCEMSLRLPQRSGGEQWFRRRGKAYSHDSRGCVRRTGGSGDHTHRLIPEYDRLTHDCCAREVTLWRDSIRIRDVVRCRLPCQAVLCQVSREGAMDAAGEVGGAISGPRAPIYVAGGRRVTIDRLYRHGQLTAFHTSGPRFDDATLDVFP